MALDTGGSFVHGTNTLSMGYARARRDLACRYTLGFYDRRPQEERAHVLRVKVNRPGLRVASPVGYAFRSAETKRASALTAAYVAPEMFQNGVIRTHVFPTRPAGRHTWDCTVAVEFPIPFGAERAGSVEREFGVILRNGSRIVSRFDRKVVVRFRNVEPGTRRVSFSQPVTLEPGTYTVTAIMTAPDEDKPYASSAQVRVPEVPREDLFLVAPVIGKRAAGDVVVNGAAISEEGRTSDEMARQDRVGDIASFMPLLVQVVSARDEVLGVTQACRTAGRGGHAEADVGRAVETQAGEVAFRWPAAGLQTAAGEGVGCRAFVDELPTTSLPRGEYVFKATLTRSGTPVATSLAAPFVLGAGPDRP